MKKDGLYEEPLTNEERKECSLIVGDVDANFQMDLISELQGKLLDLVIVYYDKPITQELIDSIQNRVNEIVSKWKLNHSDIIGLQNDDFYIKVLKDEDASFYWSYDFMLLDKGDHPDIKSHYTDKEIVEMANKNLNESILSISVRLRK